MAKKTSPIQAFEKLSLDDLVKEIAKEEHELAKIELAVKMGKEKNSAKYKAQRTKIARMKTVLTAKNRALREEAKAATLSAQSS